ncbi:hypothetical protein [Nocardia sp. MW-W600-9]
MPIHTRENPPSGLEPRTAVPRSLLREHAMSWETRGTSFTNPDYYREAADHVEAELRADFATYHQTREIAAYGETPAQVVELNARAHAIARQWQQGGTPEHQQLWQQLTPPCGPGLPTLNPPASSSVDSSNRSSRAARVSTRTPSAPNDKPRN